MSDYGASPCSWCGSPYGASCGCGDDDADSSIDLDYSRLVGQLRDGNHPGCVDNHTYQTGAPCSLCAERLTTADALEDLANTIERLDEDLNHSFRLLCQFHDDYKLAVLAAMYGAPPVGWNEQRQAEFWRDWEAADERHRAFP